MSVYITPPDSKDSWLTKLYMRITGTLSFSVNKNSVDQTVATGAGSKVTWSTLDFDTTGGFSTTNSKWTCQQGGIYEFTVQVNVNTLGSGKVLDLKLYKNGASISDCLVQAPAALTTPTYQLTKMLKLNKNDYIEVYLSHNHGSDISVTGSSVYTFFQGKRVT